MTGIVKINDKDAYTTWHAFFDSTSLSALMTPPPLKDAISNESRIEDGKRVFHTGRKVADRDITLVMQMSARNETEFFANYQSFCEELKKGRLVIWTKYQPNVYYKCDYMNCTQFTQFMRGIAKFSLRLNEPNPADRTK